MGSFADRVRDTTATTGNGSIALSGVAPTGFQTFANAFAVNDPIYYCINGGTKWEVGRGYLSNATTLVRDQILDSSNAGALVIFSAGTKSVFCTLPADEIADMGTVIAASARMISV